MIDESIPDESGYFGEHPETYINIVTGDAFIIWWAVNRPTGDDWIRVSRACYNVHVGKFAIQGDI